MLAHGTRVVGCWRGGVRWSVKLAGRASSRAGDEESDAAVQEKEVRSTVAELESR